MKEGYGKLPKSDQKVVNHLVHAEKKKSRYFIKPIVGTKSLSY